MTQTAALPWEAKRTDETRHVEDVLRKAGFDQVDAYRYNAASIRVRVIDSRFEGLSPEKRDALVEPHLEQLPDDTQADIMNLFTFAPSELLQTPKSRREFMKNTEFDNPSHPLLRGINRSSRRAHCRPRPKRFFPGGRPDHPPPFDCPLDLSCPVPSGGPGQEGGG